MVKNLKPCPLCGSEVFLKRIVSYSNEVKKAISCNNCGLQLNGKPNNLNNKEYLIRKWNNRPKEEDLKSSIDSLKNSIEELEKISVDLENRVRKAILC